MSRSRGLSRPGVGRGAADGDGWKGRQGFEAGMRITVFVPPPLRACSGGASELSLAAPTVRAALEQIERSHPDLYRSVCDETGRVRRHVALFVNRLHVRDRDGLETALAPGDVLTILPAVSGG